MFRIVLAIGLMVITSTAQAGEKLLRVHIVGVGEYKPVESLTEFKAALEKLYRVGITTSFGKSGKTLPSLEQLKTADVMVIFIRRTDLPEDQLKFIRSHWDAGKGIVALRTASHGFQEADNKTFSQVMGASYTGPGSYTAPFKAITAEGQAKHPVLNGVGPIASRGIYNFTKLADTATAIQVAESDRKIKAPATWVNTYKGGRVVYTSMGSPEDFPNADFRRLLTNAIFWVGQSDGDKLKR
ncbi:MAG: hypothetical protein EXS16_01905 [Gemmataceae bacterium]|nr:hypothetical protein [Gemmataceae bacterium]